MHYLLIHGAWQGSWCFEPLTKILKKEGHTISCVDLPGNGKDKTPVSSVTYQMYEDFIKEELFKFKEPVTVVAHSMSGIFTAPLLDRYPEKFKHLYLIAAYVAQNGKSLIDLAGSGGPSEIPEMIIEEPETHSTSLDLTKAKAFYYDCPQGVAEWALSKLKSQSHVPLLTPIHWVDSGKTKNKRTYILCEGDRDVHPITQQMVIDSYPCKVVKMKSGHFPFLSHPEKLAEILQH